MAAQQATSVSKPFLVVLVFWLTVLFISFGLYAPRNATVIAAFFFAALSVSGAIFLILEMYTPYAGIIHISSAALRNALAHLGQ
jgi:membrane-bound ClpP family serine protease